MTRQLPTAPLFVLFVLLLPAFAFELHDAEPERAFRLAFLGLLPVGLYLLGGCDLAMQRPGEGGLKTAAFLLLSPVLALALSWIVPAHAREVLRRASDCERRFAAEPARIERDRPLDPFDAQQLKACEDPFYRWNFRERPVREETFSQRDEFTTALPARFH